MALKAMGVPEIPPGKLLADAAANARRLKDHLQKMLPQDVGLTKAHDGAGATGAVANRAVESLARLIATLDAENTDERGHNADDANPGR